MTVLASLLVMAATMTSQDAILTLLNSPTSCGRVQYEQALEQVGREAANGRPLQQFVYGITVAEGETARKMLDASRDRIRYMADEKNSSLALYLLAVETNDVKLLRRAARAGNVQALNVLGTMILKEATGAGKNQTNLVEKAMKRCFSYFTRAAEQRDANAFINLGTCYLRGFGCDIDFTMAYHCFQSAADMGHPEGMDNVSACYALGHGVDKDERLSLHWRMKAKALRGDEGAREWLASEPEEARP